MSLLKKKIIKTDKGGIYVSSLEDLIRLKEIAGRPQDLIDLKILRELKEQENGL